jgi:putative ATP-binding cassette transporter
VRNNVEPIFIYGGERHETDQLHHRFTKVVSNFKQLILWKRNLGFFTESYGDLARLIPFWFLAAGYVAGRLEFGQVAQAAAAFASLHAALSIVVTSFPKLANYAKVVVRLSEFLEEAQAARTFETGGRQMIEINEAPRVELEHLTVLTPGGDKTLIRDLSADVSGLEPLLVQGPSGTGKTSLMRALAGIWRKGGGKVNRPALSDVMFLPQRPYLILGSLRDQLTYPRALGAGDQQLHEILNAVNLSDLPERFGGLDVEMHWADVLSPGEQQRVAFARLLLNHPRYAFLDEATSALDAPNEQFDVRAPEQEANSIHELGPSADPVRKFHRNILQLSAQQTWKLERSSEFEALTSAA